MAEKASLPSSTVNSTSDSLMDAALLNTKTTAANTATQNCAILCADATSTSSDQTPYHEQPSPSGEMRSTSNRLIDAAKSDTMTTADRTATETRATSCEDATPTSSRLAPYHEHPSNRIPNSYIVRFRPGHSIEDHQVFLGVNLKVGTFDSGKCYAADDIDIALLQRIRSDPGVLNVEDDAWWEFYSHQAYTQRQ